MSADVSKQVAELFQLASKRGASSSSPGSARAWPSTPMTSA